jgi:hypothetical protein
MTIFAILMPSPQPRLAQVIKEAFPNDHLFVTDTQWLVSTAGTAVELSAKVGIFDPNTPSAAPTGVAMVFATSSYAGRAQTPIWDWIKAKLEALPGG